MANPWERNWNEPEAYGQADPAFATKGRLAENAAAASDYDPALARDKLVDAQEQRRLDREKFEYQKEVDRLAREAAAIKDQPGADKAGMYNSVIQQVNRLQELYAQGIGQTSGIGGLQDYLPTDGNKQFDSAGAALADQGLAAFKIPGMGSQSDADAERFARANEPAASDRDAVVLEKLRAIRQRLENNMGAAGLAAPKWDYDVNGKRTVDKAAVDATQQQMVDGQGGGLVPTDNGFETVPDPSRAGMNTAISQMLLSGASTSEIAQYIKSKGVNPLPMLGAIDENVKIQKTNPGVKPYIQVEQMSRPLSALDEVQNNITDNSAGAFAVGGGNMLTAGLLDEIKGGNTQQTKDYLRAQYPGATFGGEMTGGLAAMLPIGRGVQAGAKALGASNVAGNAVKAGMIGDIGYGAALGAGESNDNRLGGAAMGAAAAGIGNKVGGGLVSGLGRGVRGISDPVVQRLSQAKVPLSLGQLLGSKGMAGRMVNKMESTPVVGDMLNSRRGQANDAVFNKTVQDAVDPIGAEIVGNGVDALGEAQGFKGQAYTDALSGVSAPADFQYARNIVGPVSRGNAIPGQTGQDFAHALETELRPPFGDTRTLDGNGAQEFLQRINSNAATFNKSGNFGHQASDAFREIGGATEDLISRTNPGAMERLTAANTVNARLTPIENAAITANGNVPTPMQLRRAITSNTKKFGGRSTAATGGKVPQIVEDAAQVLPSSVPNSGTADRLAAMALPAALGGGAVGMQTLTDNPTTSGILGLLAAMSTKKGAGITQAALTKRPELMQQLGEEIVKRKRLGGIFGAPAALSLAPR